jgi:hypothetical protein
VPPFFLSHFLRKLFPFRNQVGDHG